MSEVIDINSFMQVVNGTYDIEGGIEFPGHSMYNKQAVQSQGVTKAQLMQSRELAEQWFHTLKGMYERQEEEADHRATGPDLSEALARRSNPNPGEPRAPERAEESPPKSLEAQLQESKARWEAVADRARVDAEKAMAAYEAALKHIAKVEAALLAVLTVGE